MSTSNNCVNWCYVKADVNQFTYNWTIDNFCERNQTIIKSTPFHAEDSSWTLIVAPIIKNITDGNDYVGVLLNRESGDKPLWTRYTFSLMNANKDKCNAKTYSGFHYHSNSGKYNSHVTVSSSTNNCNNTTNHRQRINNAFTSMETIVLNQGSSQYESSLPQRYDYSPPHSLTSLTSLTRECSPSARNSMQFSHAKPSLIRSYISRDYLFDVSNNLLANNKLNICCDIRIFIINDPIEPLERFDTTISNDYSLLIKQHKFSDVKIIVDGVDVMAHKAILSARSPVFCAMFEHSMKESEENIVKIEDMTVEVANELFQFIYTGKVSNLGNVAKDLLAAADKYQLPQLVAICEEYLMAHLTVDTAPQILILSHFHKAVKLKSVVIDYIITNRKEVMKCDNWKLIAQQPDLMEDLFKALSNYYEKSTPFGVYCP